MGCRKQVVHGRDQDESTDSGIQKSPSSNTHTKQVVAPPRGIETFDPTRKSVEQTLNKREKINKPLLKHVIQPGETVPINYWYEA